MWRPPTHATQLILFFRSARTGPSGAPIRRRLAGSADFLQNPKGFLGQKNYYNKTSDSRLQDPSATIGRVSAGHAVAWARPIDRTIGAGTSSITVPGSIPVVVETRRFNKNPGIFTTTMNPCALCAEYVARDPEEMGVYMTLYCS